jgi:hypothetical protein
MLELKGNFRRNLEPFAIIELEEKRAVYEKRKGENQMLAGKGADGSGGRGNKKNPSQISAKGFQPIDTRKTVAERAGVSTDTVAKARVKRKITRKRPSEPRF